MMRSCIFSACLQPKSKVALGTLCDAAIVLCILHRLKAHLERKWGITPDRAAAFAAAGKRKASEDVPTLALDPGVGALDLSAGRGGADVQGAELLARAKELLAELEALHGAEVGDAQD